MLVSALLSITMLRPRSRFGAPCSTACDLHLFFLLWRLPWQSHSSGDQEGSSGKPKPSFRRTTCNTMPLVSSSRITSPPGQGFQRQPCQLISVLVPAAAVRSIRPWLRLRCTSSPGISGRSLRSTALHPLHPQQPVAFLQAKHRCGE